jgi:hypothetical protein
MANFESELTKLMQQFAPAGGFGIPNVGGIAGQYGRQSEQAYRGSLVQGNQAFDRMGLGRSVGKAFMPGTRKIQFNQDLMDALTKLFSQHGQLAESQRQNLMGMMSPIAQERANRPSWISTLLGGALGIGGQVAGSFLPGGGITMAALQKMLGGGGQASAPRSSGYGAYGQQFPQFQLPTGQWDQ